MRFIASLFAVSVLVAAACGGGDDGDSSNLIATESVNEACPSPPDILTGTTPSGDSCASATDCAPSCCSCSGSSKQYLAGNCVSGTCADPTTTCANTEVGACD